MNEIKLKTNNKLISNFDDAIIAKSIYSLDNYALLEFSEKNSEDLLKIKQQLSKYAQASILIDDTVEVTGYIADLRSGYKDSGEPCLKIKVSSYAAKYINNSVGIGKYYNKQNISDILRDLCPDLKLEIIKDRLLPQFVVYAYEDIDEAIARLCAKSNLLIYSGNHGQLIINDLAEYQNKVGSLKTGKNIINIEPIESDDYGITISGQLVFDDDVSLDKAICSRLQTAGKKQRFIYADDISQDSLAALKPKNQQTKITVPNWFDTNNQLLELNTWIGTGDKWLEANKAMLINAVDFRLNKSGYEATIGLER